MNIMEKLAELSGMNAQDPEALPGEEVIAEPYAEAELPAEAQPMTAEQAIEEAATEASITAGDLLGDAPLDSLPDVPPVVPQDVIPTQGAKNGMPPRGENVELGELQEEQERLASAIGEHLLEFGALAQVVDAAAEEEANGYLQKGASELLTYMMTSGDAFAEGIQKVASNMFGTQEDIDMLHQPEAIEYVASTLEGFVNGPLEKVASDLGDAADGDGIVNKAKSAVDGFVQSFKRLKGINQEIATMRGKLDEAEAIHSQIGTMAEPQQIVESTAGLLDARHGLAEAENFRAKGYGMAALGAGALGAGAYMAGRALGNRHEETLNHPGYGATLNAGITNSDTETGGNYKMAQDTTFMDNILKLAGANFLLTVANEEGYGMEMQKQASDIFDQIAGLNREDMGVEFAKVALENYSDEQLREVVAGLHTEEILTKVASFTAIDDLSADELVKVAGAGSVSAKGAAGALRDASEKVVNEIAAAKARAEGAGRQYAGDVEQQGAVGGKLVNNLGGYNVINNPGAYEIEQTAGSDLEQALLLKQAAYEAINEADAFIMNAITNK